MIGEIAFREEQDKVEMLAKITATLHWAAPIVARKCCTEVEHIGFFGPRKVVREGKKLLVYRLACVYGIARAKLSERVWARKAVFWDLENKNVKKKLNCFEKQANWQIPTQSEMEEEEACLG